MNAAERSERHVHFLKGEGAQSDALIDGLLVGMTSEMDRMVQIAHGTDDGVDGERVLTDPTVCPFWALPHAAQWVGGVIPDRPAGLTDEEWEDYARAAVFEFAGAYRCSPRVLVNLTKRYLTGTKTVRLVTRYLDDWTTLLLIKTGECPDTAALLAAVNAPRVVMAGGRVILLETDGIPWAQLTSWGASWQDLLDDPNSSWAELLDGTYPGP